MVRTLLVPLDGSAVSEMALPQAIALAQQTNATIHLLRVVMTVELGANPLQLEEDTPQLAEEYLKLVAEKLGRQGVAVKMAVRCGHAVEHILNYAARMQVDLIVMATHSRTGLPRVFLGSVAEQIVRRANCPVVLVHTATKAEAYEKILVPLDESPMGESVLPIAEHLARTFNAKLVLLHVVPLLIVHNTALNPVQPAIDYSLYYDEATTNAEIYLQSVAEPLREAGITVETVCKVGFPAEAIQAYAEREHVDLIVMASHTRTLLGRAIFGSVANTVLHNVDVPLMLYHYRDKPLAEEPVASTAAGQSNQPAGAETIKD